MIEWTRSNLNDIHIFAFLLWDGSGFSFSISILERVYFFGELYCLFPSKPRVAHFCFLVSPQAARVIKITALEFWMLIRIFILLYIVELLLLIFILS